MPGPVRIRAVASQETLQLRRDVLRPGHSLNDAIFEGDDESTTRHWGVFIQQSLIAVASLYQRALPEKVQQEPDAVADSNRSTNQNWQLRGMAVGPAFQGRGYGKFLLDHCLQSVEQQGGHLLWCNARTSAVGFYKSAGFQVVGSEFVIPGVGPHCVMLRVIEKPRGKTHGDR